ncbi:MAG: antibiotic biosynthesis monooxygenase [Hahellaceae bacterium]|nr:antibiotic biosynthesis monooxygenase [Hahellaceae bacterium]
MIAVIFKAEIAELDEEYFSTATRLRELAINEYGCTEFISSTEGNNELAISYWPSKNHIEKWHKNPEHVTAQNKGKSKWYKSYHVQITEVKSQYGTGT